jgi:nitrite reductase/ring-hydroxylating ferredoxin subunit
MSAPAKVAKVADIPPGTGKVVEAGGKTLAVFNCDGAFYAIDNTCVHRGGPLGEGSVSGTTVTCPWHGWEYDVKTGECAMDRAIKVQPYRVTVEGDDILLFL